MIKKRWWVVHEWCLCWVGEERGVGEEVDDLIESNRWLVKGVCVGWGKRGEGAGVLVGGGTGVYIWLRKG